jgi:hypothetical protein
MKKEKSNIAVLISGCDKMLNKTEPDKTDNKNAKQLSPSPSGSSSEFSNTYLGITIAVAVIAVLSIAGICVKCGCCFEKIVKPSS